MAEFLRRKLKNGMIAIMEKRELPVVVVSITNRFGAAFEESKIKGIAHFIEHLVFTGTKTRTHEDISREIEKKGGILNAFTANEVTSFWFKLPSEHLFAGLGILADLLKNPKFDLKKFEKEKKVILEEIKMYHDDPSRHVIDKISENLYEKPFGESIAGSEKTVSALKRDFVFDFFEKHYSPENYLATIVGDADFDKVCEYLEENFKGEGKRLDEIEIKKKNAESVEERAGIDQAHFVFAVHAPLVSEKEYYALEVLDAHLANGMSSRLFLKIREEKGLAYSVQSSVNAEKNYSYYSIYVGTTKEAVPEVKKIILEEFANISKMGDKELNEAKERVIGLRKISSEESAKVMTELLFAELAGDAKEYYEHEKKIKAVTLEQVKRLAFGLIKKYSTAAIVPK
ncbi:MAG: pitrilysin family protein [Nanoarchaeota archaeon]|mgnify:FL=1